MGQFQKIIFLTLITAVFGFAVDNKTTLCLNVTMGDKPIKESKLNIYLFIEKQLTPVKFNSDSININFFKDSAQIVIKYGKIHLQTPYYSFSQIQNLSRLDINILTKKEIKNNANYKNDELVYTVSEKPNGHGIGNYTVTEIKK